MWKLKMSVNCEYEMKEDYVVNEEERELAADEVNKLVDVWGQEVYVQ